MTTALIAIALLVGAFVVFVVAQDVAYHFLGHESRFTDVVHWLELRRARRTATRTGLIVVVHEPGSESGN